MASGTPPKDDSSERARRNGPRARFPLDPVVLDAYRKTQDRQLGRANREHAEITSARQRRRAHQLRLQALQPVLDAWLEMMRAGEIPLASEDAPGLEMLARGKKPLGCRLAYRIEMRYGLVAGPAASYWYALLTNGQWCRGSTVGSGLTGIMWGSKDVELTDMVTVDDLDGSDFVPLNREWNVDTRPLNSQREYFTFDVAIRRTIGYIGAAHKLILPEPQHRSDWS